MPQFICMMTADYLSQRKALQRWLLRHVVN
jgi:hypothetical protein